jgi:hypothetical protein
MGSRKTAGANRSVMRTFPPLLVLAVMAAVVLGLPFGLYALLTRRQRRNMRQIRAAASDRGWQYRLRRWQGNPTAFRIDGRTQSGLAWVLTSGNTRGYDRGWSVETKPRIPVLGGKVDLLMLPRDATGPGSATKPASLQAIPPAVELAIQARVAAFSGTAAGAIHFFQESREAPSGDANFDSAYRVLALSPNASHSLLDAELAKRMLHWPADTMTPHSLLAWRDPFGFHLLARLPAPPNWPTISYLTSLGDEFSARVPAPEISPGPVGLVDRIAARISR